MIDHILGRPSSSWKRTQVFLVLLFWVYRLRWGSPDGPRVLWIRRLNRAFKRFTPWQICVSVLTCLYTARHLDSILGLGSPEPLAHLYSRSYYRATWLVTGLDAGFATAMPIQPKWLRDLCAVLFSAYYIIYANEADEKLRKFRAVCTVELLRTTWEKTSNPYLRFLTYWDRPRIALVKKIILSRPSDSACSRPVVSWLFFDGGEKALSCATELILDFPGGGFVCMSPLDHEERLRRWSKHCQRPVLSIDYGKAPEYPFPYAIEECFDVYRKLVETKGTCIGMSGKQLNIVMHGDSAGGNLMATIMYKILEHSTPLPRPVALVFSYAALDFNFTSWMTPANLRVLRSEQSSSDLAGVVEQKDHFSKKSPLAVIDDKSDRPLRKRENWAQGIGLGSKKVPSTGALSPKFVRTRPMFRHKSNPATAAMNRYGDTDMDEAGNAADVEDVEEMEQLLEEHDKPPEKRVVFSQDEMHRQKRGSYSETVDQAPMQERNTRKAAIGTRLTMTSRTGYFQDRIISPSMMRAMAILYIGPKRNPDFQTDYYISPILGPSALLAEFPPLLMTCGEKDPFVDDTVIFAGRVREAKRARKLMLEDMRKARLAQGACVNGEMEEVVDESEEDWVRIAVIEGWSHGFLQMPTLIPEAREAIYRIGDWIIDVFVACSARGNEAQQRACGTAACSETETTDDALTFVPRKRRTPPPSLGRSHEERQGQFCDGMLNGREKSPEPAGAWGGEHRYCRPTQSPVVLQGEEAVASPQPGMRRAFGPGGGTGQGTSGKTAALVAEADLLKRRREEAVFGIGAVRPNRLRASKHGGGV